MMFRLHFIGFLLLGTTPLIGCGILFNINRVMRLDPVILTQDNFPTMRLMKNSRLDGFPKESSIIVGCEQRWSENQLIIRYYLFRSGTAAQKAWENPWGYPVAATVSNFHPELNPEDVIGEATWRYIPRRQTERINNSGHLLLHHASFPFFKPIYKTLNLSLFGCVF